jgi:[ribosomal protein S5]-alanine N-acetyltransferase
MEISSQRLHLRELEDADLVFLHELECNSQVFRYDSDNIPSIEYIDNKYNDIMKWVEEKPRHKYCFIVTRLEDKKTVGKVTLKLLYETIREWEIGWAFHPDYWGNGYATEASRAVIEFAIKYLKAHRITAFCNAENTQSEKLMLRVGMKKDGYLRETKILNGCWKDELVYSFLDRDLR